ncbi:hypothetical protein CJ195_02160 [Bacillus sp. UMB0899]|nr:hypothetical protein CJ195_02160 [Bacillus sp. UMB0899]
MKKSPLCWIVTTILGLVALTVVLKMIGQLFMQPYVIFSRTGELHHHNMRVMNIIDFSFLPFLFHLGLLILGWWILKKANGELVKKWVGTILLTIGVFSILPFIIALPLAFIALYIILRGKKKSNKEFTNEPIIVSTQSYNHNNQHILDEWERKTLKEETK